MKQLISSLLSIGLMMQIVIPLKVFAKSYTNRIAIVKQNSEQIKSNINSLEQGKVVKQELKNGETHYYSINLTSDQFLHVVAEQNGIDVTLVLVNPENKEVAEADSQNGNIGTESIYWIAELAGDYKLQVRSLDGETISGRYELTIKELRQATSTDKNLVTAQQAFTAGQKLHSQGTTESIRKAIEKFEEALRQWQATTDRVKEVYSLDYLGRAYDDLGEREQALDYYNQALLVERSIGDRQMEGITLNNIGLVKRSLNEMDEAIKIYNQALVLERNTNDRQMELATLKNIAGVFVTIGDKQKAIDCYTQALQLYKQAGDYRGEASTLNNIGLICRSLGEKQQALDYHNQALTLAKAKSDRQMEAATLISIGAVYDSVGVKQQALDYYNQALPLARSVRDRQLEATTLNNLGLVYRSLGEKDRALTYYSQALSIARAISDFRMEATTLHNIARSYDSAEETKPALDYLNQALKIERKLGDRNGEVYTLSAIGVIYDSLGERQKALDFYNQSLSLAQTINDRRGEAVTLNNIGLVYQSLGNLQKALDHYKRVLPLWRAMSDRSGEAVTLYNTAHIERTQDKLTDALGNIKKAIDLIEFIRTSVISKDLRISYFASVQDFYELYIDLLLRLHAVNPDAGYDGESLRASEKARARSLIELLAEAQADLRQGIDLQLLERERILQRRLNIKEQNRMRLLERKHTGEEEETANKDIDSLLTEYRQLQSEIRQKNPHYAGLTQPQPVSLDEIQSQVLDDDTLMLEYFLGKEKSYLWAVTKTSINTFTLPRQAEIDELAQQLYLFLIERSEAAKEYRAGRISSQQRADRIAKADTEYPKVAIKLSQMILGPVARQLGKKRLLLVADGALQYVPFSTLVEPGDIQNDEGSQKLLILNHEIISLPSVSTLAMERKYLLSRKAATRTVAVIADPVFDENDERVKNIAIKVKEVVKENFGAEAARILDRISEDIETDKQKVAGRRLRVPRLPFTDEEARRIISLVQDSTTMKATGYQANRTIATSSELSTYKYIHYATHGYLDAERPEFSAIILSMLNDKGETQDGFLRAHEIFNLNLPAEMVVLSACETGLGREIKGEGLVGLTRGFMYAGAARVVVSLWGINDRATSELIVRFYKKVLTEGYRPAAALRAAQIELFKETEFKSPYYWAPFIIQGEWR
jgi:CHAT domain-containing protein/Tfp pilus assembly protein PilF